MPGFKLLVMRLADMKLQHPLQDNSRVCSQCKQQVGIYPSGQAVIEKHPDTLIVCSVCDEQKPHDEPRFLAPGALTEPFESKRRKDN